MAVPCRVSTKNFCPLGVIEGQTDGLPVATSLNRPGAHGRVVARCLNLTGQPMKLKAGTTIGTFTGVEEKQVESFQPLTSSEATDIKITQETDGNQVPEHLTGLYEAAKGGCEEPSQARKLARLLTEYSTVFSTGDGDVGRTTLVEHSIPVEEGTRPIRQPPHRLGPEKEAEAEKQVTELLEKGLIEPASGAWSSPVVLVRKKDGKWRFCVDYRRLNAVTQQDAYPLPRIDDSLDALSGSKFFSTLDLISGYWQVPLDADASEKSAFATRSGLWKWKVLPFGLTSAPATFQRLMERVLHGLHWKSLLLYLDDIIVIAPDFSTHLHRLEEVLKRLQQAGLKLKPSKCELLQPEVRYLGHIVSSTGVATDPEKVAAVKDWPRPQGVKQLQAFLGTVGYYRQYVPEFATIAQPLHKLTSKEAEWKWGEAEQESFEELKLRLVSAPVLGYPDPTQTYILDTDASGFGVGAVLSQVQEGQERVIAYYSKTLAPPERNYCVTRRELLATVKAIKHFRPYLYGRKFKLRTDHASLRWLCRRKEPSNQVARWLEILAEFNYTLEHRAGVKHGNADGLSRQSCEDCKQCGLIERRDGGPTRQELDQCDDEPFSSALKGAEESGRTKEHLLTEINKIMTRTAGSDTELAKEQASGTGPVAIIYKALQDEVEVTSEQLDSGSAELKRLNKMRGSLRLRPDGVLEARVAPQGKSRWCAICPPSLRGHMVWTTHALAHSGVVRTTNRLQLTWYWPGMTAMVRRMVKSCEICQAAKHGGTKGAQGKQRLHAGRPWQKVAIDLVGPMPETARGNRWILVLVDHFTRWQDALAIPDATAAVVATVLDERVFCYMGLPEQIHTDQGAQFESQLMTELCQLWGIDKTRTTPYHPQANGVVERNNRGLGDSLRAMLLGRGQDEWDTLLPQILRAYRGTPHTTTGETANMLMLGRELRLPDQLQHQPPPEESRPQNEFVIEMRDRLEQAHEALRQQQLEIRQDDQDEPLLFAPKDLVWLENRRRRKGENNKLQQKFVGPYQIIEAYSNHTYLIERQGQSSVQNEVRLKLYYPCTAEPGRAPASLEPRRRPNMKGALGNRRQKEATRETEVLMNPPIPSETRQEMNPTEEILEREPITEPAIEPATELSEDQEPTVAIPTPQTVSGRPRRATRKPIRYEDYECNPCMTEQVTATEKWISRGTTPERLKEVGPAHSRPQTTPPGSQNANMGTEKDPEVRRRVEKPLNEVENPTKITAQEWPKLQTQRRNTMRPAMSRLWKLASGPPQTMRKKPESYAAICKKQLDSKYTRSPEKREKNLGLFYCEDTLPQEVSEKAGSELAVLDLADSQVLLERERETNPIVNLARNRHPTLQDMDQTKGKPELDTDGEFDNSLIKLLEELPDFEEMKTEDKINPFYWSDNGLLSDSDTETEAALEVAAQSVEKERKNTEINTQRQMNSKSQGDNFQPEVKTNADETIQTSVLKVTEGMEVFSINQISQGKHMARKIIPHKEMPRVQTTIQAGMPGDLPNKQAGIPGPAKPAQAWEKIPTNQEPVLLEVTEDNDWLKDLAMSNSSASDSEAETVEETNNKRSIAQPVLKVTGGPTGEKTRNVKTSTPQPPGKNQFTLKAVNGKRHKKLQKPHKVDRLNAVSSIVGEGDNDRQVAIISPVKPPTEKRLKLELTRIESTSSKSIAENSSAEERKVGKIQRIPTVEWVTRQTKDLVERAVVNGRTCGLCQYETSKRRIRIHIRQHYVMHFCQCGYQNVSRDQVAEHQKTTKRAGHTRANCSVYMVSESQFPAFKKFMKWPSSKSFGQLLPAKISQSKVKIETKYTTEPKSKVNAVEDKEMGITPMPLITGYRIPRKVPTEIDTAEPVCISEPEEAESPPPQLPLQKEKESGGRWLTTTKPHIQIVEVDSRTPLERLLQRRTPSEIIPSLRSRRMTALEQDADYLEEEARRVDTTRRKIHMSTEEEQLLREESRKLRTEAAHLRHIADQLSNRH